MATHNSLTGTDLHLAFDATGGATGASARQIAVANGSNGATWQNVPYGGVYADHIGAHLTITGSGAATTRISAVETGAAQTSAPVEFTVGSNGELTYTGSLTRHFHIACSISINVGAGTNVTCKAQLQKWTNSTSSWAAITGTNVEFNIAAADAHASTAIHGDVMLSSNDKVVLAIENTDSATDLQLVTYYLFMNGMPGA